MSLPKKLQELLALNIYFNKVSDEALDLINLEEFYKICSKLPDHTIEQIFNKFDDKLEKIQAEISKAEEEGEDIAYSIPGSRSSTYDRFAEPDFVEYTKYYQTLLRREEKLDKLVDMTF
jgi:hypothetical protein